MNLNHLQAFVKVVQTKSFQEASRILNVSQPAITLRIKALEDYFKTTLLQRNSNGVVLTAQGEQVYFKIINMLAIWDELSLQFLGGELKGKLEIGASTIPTDYLLPSILKEFQQLYPEINFNLKVAGSKEVISWLVSRKVDFIIAGKPIDTTNIKSIAIFDERLKLITPIDFNSTNIDYLNENWVIREPESNNRRAMERALSLLGMNMGHLKISIQAGSTESVISSVEAGLGISMISELAANRAANFNRVQAFDLGEINVGWTFYLSYLNENQHHPLIQAFCNHIQTQDLNKRLR